VSVACPDCDTWVVADVAQVNDDVAQDDYADEYENEDAVGDVDANAADDAYDVDNNESYWPEGKAPFGWDSCNFDWANQVPDTRYSHSPHGDWDDDAAPRNVSSIWVWADVHWDNHAAVVAAAAAVLPAAR